LIEDIGFQLSFLATLGILLVKPLLDSWLAVWKDKIRFISTLNDDITTTLSAQIVTLPILLGVFGSYGLLSVLANALTLWTIPILMTLGSLAILLGIVFAPLGKLFLFLSYPLLWFFETVVNFLGQVGWVLEIPAMPMVVWFGYYLILGAIVWSNKKQIQNRKEPLIVREV
jgi:competence protein ComEC